MAIITEDYVSDETFKLLKEKGFDDSCCYFVVESNETYHRGAPTLQMAMKWLRELYNIVIVIDVCRETGREGFYCWQLENNRTGDWIDNIIGECPTYEQACETAIKYCLEHLI